MELIDGNGTTESLWLTDNNEFEIRTQDIVSCSAGLDGGVRTLTLKHSTSFFTSYQITYIQ